MPYFLICITLYFVSVMSLLNWNYMPDDGYRYLHVVSNILEGHGVRWNVIDPEPSQSFTSFPWILSLVAISSLINIELVDLAKICGLLYFSITIIFISNYVRKNSENVCVSLVFLSLAIVLSPVIFFHTINGMETMLFVLFLSISVVNFLISINNKKYLIYTFLAFLFTVLIRYESVIFCGILCLYLMHIYRDDFKFFIKKFLLFLIIPGLLYVALIYFYFGNLLPNSFHVKTAVTLISPSGYSYFIANYNNFFLGCSLAFISTYPFSKNPNKLAYLFIFVAMHVQLLFILRIIPTVGQGGRFMFPYVVPLYLLTINITIQTILERLKEKNIINTSIASVLIFLLVFSTHSDDRKEALKGLIAYSSDRVMDPVIGKSIAKIQTNKPSDIAIIGGESGAISYFSKFTFVDIWGLHDAHIAKNGLDNNYIFSYEPDMFISFVHNEALEFDKNGNYKKLNAEFIKSRIEIDEKNKDVKGNTAYYSYLVMIDQRFEDMNFIRKIEIGSGKSWVFFVNRNSNKYDSISNAFQDINWDDEKQLITSSMRPSKIINVLRNPFKKENYIRVEAMFDE